MNNAELHNAAIPTGTNYVHEKKVRDREGKPVMNLEELVRMLKRQAEGQKVGRVPQVELSAEEDVFELEEDMGALRLLRLQAALKERRILESKG